MLDNVPWKIRCNIARAETISRARYRYRSRYILAPNPFFFASCKARRRVKRDPANTAKLTREGDDVRSLGETQSPPPAAGEGGVLEALPKIEQNGPLSLHFKYKNPIQWMGHDTRSCWVCFTDWPVNVRAKRKAVSRLFRASAYQPGSPREW